MWSDHGCQALAFRKCAASCEKSLQRRSLAVLLHPGIESEALVEECPGVVGPSGLQMLDDAPAGRQIDDRTVNQRIVELTQLEQDAVDPGDVVQVDARFLEELDGVVVPLAEPESPTMTLGLGRVVPRLVSHVQRLPRRAPARYLRRGSCLRP